LRVYNLIYLGDFYTGNNPKDKLKTAVMLFIISTLMFGIGLLMPMLELGALYLPIMFQLEGWLYLVNSFLFVVEIIIYMSKVPLEVKAYNARETYKND
jgi:hypothetical protein